MKALFATLVLAGSAAHALDIKGINVDSQIDCAQIAALETRSGTVITKPDGPCQSRRPEFVVETSFLDGSARLFILQNSAGVVRGVFASQFNFRDALDALTKKFGAPKLEISSVQNRMGAAFEQSTATWADGETVLVLKRHGAKLNSPSLTLTGRTFRESAEAERQQKAAKGADNI